MANQENTLLNIDSQKVLEMLRNESNKGQVYQILLTEFESAVLEEVMVLERGNQTRAAEILGLNRGTLRKKLGNLGLI